jgi:hypothetical protein
MRIKESLNCDFIKHNGMRKALLFDEEMDFRGNSDASQLFSSIKALCSDGEV